MPMLGIISVVLVSAWARNTQVENIIHRQPKPVFFGKCLCCPLLYFKGIYMWLANSTLCFI